jgi:hypothetical protein
VIDGVTVRMGGADWVIPPLNFRLLRKLQTRLADLTALGRSGAPTADVMDAVVDLVHPAMQRNYPEITREQVEDMLDMGNMGPTIQAIMGASGVVQTQAGEPTRSAGETSTQT